MLCFWDCHGLGKGPKDVKVIWVKVLYLLCFTKNLKKIRNEINNKDKSEIGLWHLCCAPLSNLLPWEQLVLPLVSPWTSHSPLALLCDKKNLKAAGLAFSLSMDEPSYVKKLFNSTKNRVFSTAWNLVVTTVKGVSIHSTQSPIHSDIPIPMVS